MFDIRSKVSCGQPLVEGDRSTFHLIQRSPIHRGWCTEGSIYGVHPVVLYSTHAHSALTAHATANEFDPDRFLDDRAQKYLAPNPFIFLPFNAGPRVCLGQQFAYNEASVVISRIVQTFKVIRLDMDSNPGSKPPTSWAAGGGRKSIEKVWVTAHMTAYAKGGVWVKMEEVDSE